MNGKVQYSGNYGHQKVGGPELERIDVSFKIILFLIYCRFCNTTKFGGGRSFPSVVFCPTEQLEV